MAAKTYMTEFDALERWFAIGETPAWILFRGFSDSHSGRSNRIYSQTDTNMGKDESFALLRTLITDNSAGGGDFTVFIQPKTGTAGQSAHYRVLGIETQTAGSRLGGFPGAPMVGYVAAGEVQAKIDAEKRMWELERKLEDMEAAAAEEMSFGKVALGQLVEDGTLSRVVESLAPAVGQVIANFLSKLVPMPAQQATVAMSGFPAAAEEATDTVEEDQYDPIRIAAVLNRLRPHFDSHEGLYVYLEKVTDFFEKNPAMAKSFFK
ncbi:MAG: hypothetical protein KF852_04195 [Saprospiraceae bacterium]|nr:hypothetical protein [Saprospiraceae bacterium]